MADQSARLPKHFATILLITVFFAWSLAFLYQSSFVAIDSKRYFTLFDDAMISMRYGWNLAHGNGLVWNPGQKVEGYTNFLMTILMALTSIPNDKRIAVLMVQMLGIVVLLLTSIGIMRIADMVVPDASEKPLFRALSCLGVLAYYPLLYWSLLGMETGLLTLCLTISVLYALKFSRTIKLPHAAISSIAVGFAFLTRPDAILAAFPILIFLFYSTRKDRSLKLSIRLGSVIFFILIGFVAGHTLFRLFYYGEVFPNTYVLKVSGIPLLSRLRNGFYFVAPFLESITWISLIAAAALLLSYTPQNLFLASFLVILTFYQVWVGGDAWTYWRIMAPAMPLFWIVALSEIFVLGRLLADFLNSPPFNSYVERNAIVVLRNATRRRFARIRTSFSSVSIAFLGIAVVWFCLNSFFPLWIRLAALLAGISCVVLVAFRPDDRMPVRQVARASVIQIVVVIVLLAGMNKAFWKEIFFVRKPAGVSDNELHTNTAIAIDKLTTAGASVGVFWAGTIPYYTGRKAIDFLGKTDRHIARLSPDLSGAVGWEGFGYQPGHNKYDLNYSILQLRPTYIQGAVWGSQNLNEVASTHYKRVMYKGMTLYFLQSSPHVLWEEIGP